jgi:hypothetical protein
MPRDGARTSPTGRYNGPPMTLGNMRENGVRTPSPVSLRKHLFDTTTSFSEQLSAYRLFDACYRSFCFIRARYGS